jgi:hypothetical protein
LFERAVASAERTGLARNHVGLRFAVNLVEALLALGEVDQARSRFTQSLAWLTSADELEGELDGELQELREHAVTLQTKL